MFKQKNYLQILRSPIPWLAIVLLSFLVSCSPQQTVQFATLPVQGETEEIAQDDFFFEIDGYRLYYDPQLVIDVQPPVEVVPENMESGPGLVPHPEFAHFNLYMEQAQVYVAPLEAYQAVWEPASGIIEGLDQFIDQPISHKGCIPELPLDEFFHECGHQQFGASISQLRFQNGFGVRFVTVYAIHDAAPVDNDNLRYVFQGFTDDDAYYVKVVVRLLHDQLPQTGEIPPEIYASNDRLEVFAYFDNLSFMLEGDPDGYAPDLEWIDAFISSFRVAVE